MYCRMNEGLPDELISEIFSPAFDAQEGMFWDTAVAFPFVSGLVPPTCLFAKRGNGLRHGFIPRCHHSFCGPNGEYVLTGGGFLKGSRGSDSTVGWCGHIIATDARRPEVDEPLAKSCKGPQTSPRRCHFELRAPGGPPHLSGKTQRRASRMGDEILAARGGWMLQQYMVDCFASVDQSRLNFLRRHQKHPTAIMM
ncbi:hypothetical protein B0H14DRAFT_2582483 [Mycena olivaceomarginata]|nr:hypothetical protein B0H14DRAFT_2582483 [Mycena olivaceomarginata]